MLDRAVEAARLAPMAEAGLSLAQAARALGLTRNTVIGRARDCGVRFQGTATIGGGCNRAQALRGWATRRTRQDFHGRPDRAAATRRGDAHD